MGLDADLIDGDGLVAVGDAATKVFDVMAADGRVDVHLDELFAPLFLFLVILQVIVLKDICCLQTKDIENVQIFFFKSNVDRVGIFFKICCRIN